MNNCTRVLRALMCLLVMIFTGVAGVSGSAVLNLHSTATGYTVVSIYSNAGAIKKRISFHKVAGTVSQPIDLGGLTAGLYYMEAVTGSQRTITKLIKL